MEQASSPLWLSFNRFVQVPDSVNQPIKTVRLPPVYILQVVRLLGGFREYLRRIAK
jgi:hypothetical protein